MAAINEFVTQIGSAEKGGEKRTFVRVVHTPTGKERTVVGIENESALAVEERLIREIANELDAA